MTHEILCNLQHIWSQAFQISNIQLYDPLVNNNSLEEKNLTNVTGILIFFSDFITVYECQCSH